MKLKYTKRDKILLIDFKNVFFSGFVKGMDLSVDKYAMVEQFLISLNSYIRMHDPKSVIIVDDGNDIWRYKLYADYKKNRKKKEDDEFWGEKEANLILTRRLLRSKILPISYFRESVLEADDLAYLVIKEFSNEKFICVSSDGDYLQLIDKFGDRVQIYNQLKKCFVERPMYDIVRYKCLVGDSSDNLKGIRGIGKKKVGAILDDFDNWIDSISDEEFKQYELMHKLVDLDIVSMYKKANLELQEEKLDIGKVIQFFDEFGFERINREYFIDNIKNLK